MLTASSFVWRPSVAIRWTVSPALRFLFSSICNAEMIRRPWLLVRVRSPLLNECRSRENASACSPVRCVGPTANSAPENESLIAAGPNHLTGDQALAFSRDRHSFSSGDLTRTGTQGLLIISALQTLQKRNLSAGDTVRLVATLGRHVKLDAVSIGELFQLGQYSLTLDPANIRNVVLPVGSGGSGTNLVKTEAAASLLADFVDDGALQSH